MTKQEWALFLASKGFWVFRLKPNKKTPARTGWQEEATIDTDKIKKLFTEKSIYNIGIFTSKYKTNESLTVVDEDNKEGKDGAGTLLQLEFEGCSLSKTTTQSTPTGGKHHIYSCRRPVKQGADVLGNGLDIRSRGGYIVGAGSELDGKVYTINTEPVVEVSDWVLSNLTVSPTKEKKDIDLSKIDPARARERAEAYLELAPIAEEGSRNDTAYKVICECKDRGVSEAVCLELILEWNEENEPPLDTEELENTITSAYNSGQNAVGTKAAEAIFETVEKTESKKETKNWFDALNEEFALVMAGGGHHILWECKDEHGKYKLDHLNEASFHKMLAYKTIQMGKKTEMQTKVWLADKDARRYDGLTFSPEREVSPRFFNMWRGFTVEPMLFEDATPQAQAALDDYLDHALNNVCNGDEKLFHYLMCYAAHIFQKPWQKPLVALVFKGAKGVGKNAFIKFINDLLGMHAILTAKKRFLLGQFNSHFEACLTFTLDEAVWGGDKEAEGGLKDLITGDYHNIELKGKEMYKVTNLTRVFIIGNEAWLVPASDDERRYAIFNVNANKQMDTKFFDTMRINMEAGGSRLLLNYFLSYDIKGTNINIAPQTQGLLDQKIASLDMLGQWWFDCLMGGELVGSSATDIDFTSINTNFFRRAFQEYTKQRRITARLPSDIVIGKEMKRYAPSMKRYKVFGAGYEYRSPGLADLRKDWEKFIKGEIEWPITEEEGDPLS